jgi:hypothetical protein
VNAEASLAKVTVTNMACHKKGSYLVYFIYKQQFLGQDGNTREAASSNLE